MFKTYTELAGVIRQYFPEVAWIDLDKGQLDNPADFESIQCPGVLVKMDKIDWQGPMGFGEITTRLIFVLASETYESDPNLADSVAQLAFAEQVDERLCRQDFILANTQTRQFASGTFYVIESTYDARYDKDERHRTVTLQAALQFLPTITKKP